MGQVLDVHLWEQADPAPGLTGPDGSNGGDLATVLTAVVILVMICVRVWNYRGPGAAQPITGPVAAGLLLLIAWGAELELGRPTGRSVAYALVGVLVLAACCAAALAIPPIRRLLAQATPAPHPWRSALRDIPLATVTFEEVAFRGVLWASIARDFGGAWATIVTAVLFGLWHIKPHRERPVVVAGTVAFTGLAGALLAVLCQAGGSLVVPFAIHWAANAFGVLTVKAAHTGTGAGGP
jgi:uncharacterized protein